MAARLIICNIKCENSLKQGAKLQQARLIGASDNVNKRMEPAACRGGGHRRLL